MGQFLYYLGGVEAIGGKVDLGRLKLGYAFEGEGYLARECFSGPDKGKGVIVSAVGEIERVGYFAEGQTWRPIPGLCAHENARPQNRGGSALAGAGGDGSAAAAAGAVWLGWWNGDMPGPGDLARGEQLPGGLVKLGDGREWLIPRARQCEDSGGVLFPTACLPRVFDMSPEGKYVWGRVEAPYRRFWGIAEEAWDKYIRGDGAPLTWLVGASAIALGVNYRLGDFEAVVLGLLTERTVPAVVREMVDYNTYLEWWSKKKIEEPPARPGSECGAPGETADTGPRSGSG